LIIEIETAQPKPSNHASVAKRLRISAQPSLTTSEYVHSPTAIKRRRVSYDKEDEPARPRQVLWMYETQEPTASRLNSPSYLPQPAPVDIRTIASRRSPFIRPSGAATTVTLSAREMTDARSPTAGLPSPPRSRNYNLKEGDSPRIAPPSGLTGFMDPPDENRIISYPYQQHHPSHYQSLSTGSILPYEQSPFTTGDYPIQYQEVGQYDEVGNVRFGSNDKQRKRRGNLPKETVDKLWTWFVAHLQHPYPTEDEKQDLMRHTGLQMSKSQPSKWRATGEDSRN
jgi:hypothetical protein